jgi:hypothetical protein
MTNKEFKQILIDHKIAEKYSNEMIKELSETYTGTDKSDFVKSMIAQRDNLKNPKKLVLKKTNDNGELVELPQPDPDAPHFSINTIHWQTYINSHQRLIEELTRIEIEHGNSDTELLNFVSREQAENYIKEQVLSKADKIKNTKDATRYLIREKYRFKSRLNHFYTEQGYSPEHDTSGEIFDPVALIEAKIEELRAEQNKVEKIEALESFDPKNHGVTIHMTPTEIVELIRSLNINNNIRGTNEDILKYFSKVFDNQLLNEKMYYRIMNDMKKRSNGSETLFLDKLKTAFTVSSQLGNKKNK